MFRQMLCNLHRAIDGFALDRFVDETPGFGLTRTERLPHENVPERGRHANGAGEPLCSAWGGQKTEFRFRQSDQIVAVFGDANVAGQSEFESAGKSGAGDRGNDRLRHRLADRHGLIKKPAMIGCAIRPLAARSANLFDDINERGNIKMAIKIPGVPPVMITTRTCGSPAKACSSSVRASPIAISKYIFFGLPSLTTAILSMTSVVRMSVFMRAPSQIPRSVSASRLIPLFWSFGSLLEQLSPVSNRVLIGYLRAWCRGVPDSGNNRRGDRSPIPQPACTHRRRLGLRS